MSVSIRRLRVAVALLAVLSGVSAVRASERVHRPGVWGKEFFIAFPRSAYGSQTVGVEIQSPVAQKLRVTPPVGPITTITLPHGDTVLFFTGPFSIESLEQMLRKHKATRIAAEHPIKLIGQYGVNATAGTFDALPIESWGTDYIVLDAPEGTNADYAGYPAIYSIPTIMLVGGYPSTLVTITPSAATSKGNQPGVSFTVTLDSGDVYTIASAGSPVARVPAPDVCVNDFSGTVISSTNPVGVVVAQSHGSYPCGNSNCGDYGVEWLPPVQNWDTMYVIPPSVQRAPATPADGMRIVFARDNTNLWMVDASGVSHLLGIFPADSVLDETHVIGFNLTFPAILHANNPFLVMTGTPYPFDCDSAGGGSEPWAFSMAYAPGVHSWSDDVPLLTATSAQQTVLDLVFRRADTANLFLDDTLFTRRYRRITPLPLGFAWVRDTLLQPDRAYRVRGINGARAGGLLYGHGSAFFGANDGRRTPPHLAAPMVIKSFGHGVGGSATHLFVADSLAPRDSIVFQCGHWGVSVADDETDPPASGIAMIDLVAEGADSSFNVRYAPAPPIDPGASQTTFGIDVVNLMQPARAGLLVRDLAGNERDTVLTYNPLVVDAVPPLVDAGSLRAGDSTVRHVTLFNRGATGAAFTAARLRFGTAWRIVPPSPTAPFTIPAGDSAVFTFRFAASTDPGLVCNADTLLVTTCKEFPIAAMTGCNKRPAITTTSFDFGALDIDTTGQSGQQRMVGLLVLNTGTDTLHVTDYSVVGVTTPSPDSDFSVGINVTRPTAQAPWVLAPGDTITVDVVAHPHHSGVRTAYIYYANDADHLTNDTSWITVTGIGPTAVPEQALVPGAADVSNYPNPFAGSTTLQFRAPGAGACAVTVLDQLGAPVARLLAERTGADGSYRARWDAARRRSGVYWFEARDASGTVLARGRVLLLK